jgi:hypothetical protein
MKTMIRFFSIVLLSFSLTTLAAEKAKKLPGGADYQQGWIIKRTKDGIIKIPKKQGFVFTGSELEAEANRPGTGVFGSRPDRDRLSLIPIRKSFRREALSASGLVTR